LDLCTLDHDNFYPKFSIFITVVIKIPNVGLR
jgi:hypothetical protein